MMDDSPAAELKLLPYTESRDALLARLGTDAAPGLDSAEAKSRLVTSGANALTAAFARPFSNSWLWAAIAGSLALQVAVVHAPPLQRAFGTSTLEPAQGGWCLAVASTVLWVREADKATSAMAAISRVHSR